MNETKSFQRIWIFALSTIIITDIAIIFTPSKAFALLASSQKTIASFPKTSPLFVSDISNTGFLVSQSVDIDVTDDGDDYIPAKRLANKTISRVIPCRILSTQLGIKGLRLAECLSNVDSRNSVLNRRTSVRSTVQNSTLQNDCSSGTVQSSSQSNKVTGDGRTVSQSSSTTNCQ